MLSYEDIINEIGDNIFLYPLNVDNIRGNSINLTASNIAYSNNGRNLIEKIDGKERIVINNGEVALIETEETIYVSNNIGGTYHSKVGKVSQGLSHIGTTLDPGYIGTSLIAICNNSDSKVEFDVGDTIVSVVLYYLKTPTTYKNTNSPSDHITFFEEAKVGSCEVKNIRKKIDNEWNKNKINLKSKMENDHEYNKLREDKEKLITEKNKRKIESRNKKIKFFVIMLIGAISLGFILYQIDKKFVNVGSFNITEKYIIVLVTVFLTKLIDIVLTLKENDYDRN